jgi:hypothetical protein
MKLEIDLLELGLCLRHCDEVDVFSGMPRLTLESVSVVAFTHGEVKTKTAKWVDSVRTSVCRCRAESARFSRKLE